MELSRKVGIFHIDMVCFVISVGMWYWCRGFLLFCGDGLLLEARSLALLVRVPLSVYSVNLM